MRPFFWVDSKGIPLEMVIRLFEKHGVSPTLVIMLFMSDALKAGWKKDKIISEVREMRNFGIELDPRLGIPEFKVN